MRLQNSSIKLRILSATIFGVIPSLFLNLTQLPITYALSPTIPSPIEKVDYKRMQWGLSALGISSENNYIAPSTVVAVLDTGIDYRVKNLEGSLLKGYSTVYNSELDEEVNYDEVGHGTHVASIIAGKGVGNQPLGIAPGVKILPIQVLSSRGGSDQQVAAGIDYAINAKVSVINLSLGGEVNPFSEATPITCDAIYRAYQASIPVVVAAGNSGSRGNPLNQPASCPYALSVAALDPTLSAAPFTSFDKSVFISAPGVDIVANIPNIDEQFQIASWSGTSMATPFISGAIALYRSKNPNDNVETIKTALINSTIDIGTPGFDAYTGNGLLSLKKLLYNTTDTLSKLRSEIKKFTSPLIVEASYKKDQLHITFEKSNTLLSSKTEVVLNYADGSQQKVEVSNRSGNKVISKIENASLIREIFIRVVDKNNIVYYSIPYSEILDANPVVSVPVKPDLKKFSAKFKGDNLQIEYLVDRPEGKELSFWIFSDDAGIFIEKKFMAEKSGVKIIKVEDGRLLEHALSLTLSSQNTLNYLLAPKYLIAVNTEEVNGENYVTVQASFLCILHIEVCKTAEVKLFRDKKILKTAPVSTIGEGLLVYKGSLKSTYLMIGSFRSRVIG